MRKLRRIVVLGSLAVAAWAAVPSPAAAVTIGQTGANGLVTCSADDEAQPPVSTGTQYAVPSTGGIVNWTLTSWSHQAEAAPDQQTKLKVWRQVSGLTYTVVGQDGPRSLTSGVLNTFTAGIPVKPGDILGITPITNNVSCAFGPFGETYYLGDGDAATGAQVTFIASTGKRLNISAEVVPTNTFTIGTTTRNKKRGTATVSLDLPNPGELTASGTGAKVAGVASTAKAVSGPGTATLLVKAKGKKKRKLNSKGKVKLGLTISFTPTGGAAATVSTKVKLKKKV
jgi:hypothetical protein